MKKILNKDKLNEQYEEALFALLMDKFSVEEGQRLIEENERLNDDSAFKMPDGLEARCEKVIGDAFATKKREKVLQKSGKALSRVAITFIVCGVVFATLFTTVSAFREVVYKFLVEDNIVSTDTKVRDKKAPANEVEIIEGNRLDIPSGAYLPTWVPDGYILKTYTNNVAETSAIYGNDDNDLIMYFEYVNDQVLGVDTENADSVENISINGFDALVSIKGKVISVTWIDSDRNILVRISTTNLDKETVLKISGSVKGN